MDHQTDLASEAGETTRRWGTASNRELKRARPGEAPVGPPGRFLFATIDELGEAALNLAAAENPGRRRSRRAATTVLARWLEQWPGQGWHDKWASSGSDDLLTNWWTVTELDRARSRQAMTTLIALRAVRPSYAWMAAVELTSLTQKFQDINELDDFSLIHHAADQLGLHAAARVAANTTLVRIMVATGKVMAEITKDDIFACTTATQDLGRRAPAHALWQLLRHAGFLAGEAPTLQAASALGRSSVEEMVDRHQPACRPVRDVFVDYLKHRAAALDYPSLWALCYYLVSLFWSDLEKHQPGISSFVIEPQAVQAWKSRMQGRMAHVSYLKVLVMVRAFYLDVAEWALQEPERWGPWAAPCPVRAHELKGHSKIAHKTTARMHARTRTLAPLLPALARSAREWMKETGDLLVPARAAAVGDEFVVKDRRYRRLGRQGRTGPKIVVLELFGENRRIDVSWTEDDAFWSWAVIEVLRLTGVRGEELLELTHLGVRQYVRRDGELTPLLQISPSKTDRERVIPMSPELVHVLARILRRVRGPGGTVPLVQRYDGYERVFSEPLPYLFQRAIGSRLVVMGHSGVLKLLTRAAERAGLTEVDGQAVRFTAHDFRRIFATEIVNSGLPIHIGAKLLGHLDLNTTQRYVAVYPEEVIRHFEAHIARRRAERPGDEYREPTSEEWKEFEEHFALRKVALGDCGRPYGTPCIHEHACVRCPFLRVDPSQLHRLVELEDNTSDRIREAEERGWLGEVAGLNESLIQIGRKKEQVAQLHEGEQLSLV